MLKIKSISISNKVRFNFTKSSLENCLFLILSRACKSTSKSKTWLNIENFRRSAPSEFGFANITFIDIVCTPPPPLEPPTKFLKRGGGGA